MKENDFKINELEESRVSYDRRESTVWLEIKGFKRIAHMTPGAYLFDHELGQCWMPKAAVKFERKIEMAEGNAEYRVLVASWFDWDEKLNLMKQGKVVSDEFLEGRAKAEKFFSFDVEEADGLIPMRKSVMPKIKTLKGEPKNIDFDYRESFNKGNINFYEAEKRKSVSLDIVNILDDKIMEKFINSKSDIILDIIGKPKPKGRGYGPLSDIDSELDDLRLELNNEKQKPRNRSDSYIEEVKEEILEMIAEKETRTKVLRRWERKFKNKENKIEPRSKKKLIAKTIKDKKDKEPKNRAIDL